jgi:hypothetical protein
MMTRLLGVLVLIAAGILGLGYYLGWFHFAKDSADDNKLHYSVTVDEEKILDDKKKAQEKVQGVGQPVKDSAAVPVKPQPNRD